MNNSFIQENIAQRLGGNQFGKDDTIYKFEKIKRAKRAAMEANPDTELIDMGVGEPDEPAFPIVVETLSKEAGKSSNLSTTARVPKPLSGSARNSVIFHAASINRRGRSSYGSGSRICPVPVHSSMSD